MTKLTATSAMHRYAAAKGRSLTQIVGAVQQSGARMPRAAPNLPAGGQIEVDEGLGSPPRLGPAVDPSRLDLDEKVEKVRFARKRLLDQGNPSGINVGEPAPVRVSPTPTIERDGKSGHGLAEVVIQEPSGRFVSTRRDRSPIEAYQKSFTEEEIHVAAQFIRDAELATAVNITAAYDGAPRQVAGPRSGGVPDRHREAHVRFTAMWREMHESYRHVAKWLVLEVRREQTGETASVGDIGAEMTGMKDKATARGVGVGLLKATLWRIGEMYRRDMRK